MTGEVFYLLGNHLNVYKKNNCLLCAYSSLKWSECFNGQSKALLKHKHFSHTKIE